MEVADTGWMGLTGSPGARGLKGAPRGAGVGVKRGREWGEGGAGSVSVRNMEH